MIFNGCMSVFFYKFSNAANATESNERVTGQASNT